MKKNYFLFMVAVILSISFISSQTPQLPMIISGNVSINDNLAKQDIKIEAIVNGEIISEAKTNENGEFNMLLQKLENDQPVSLYVDEIYTNKTVSYKSGGFEQLSLKVEKSYSIYYLGVALLLLIIGLLIWKRKVVFNLRKK